MKDHNAEVSVFTRGFHLFTTSIRDADAKLMNGESTVALRALIATTKSPSIQLLLLLETEPLKDSSRSISDKGEIVTILLPIHFVMTSEKVFPTTHVKFVLEDANVCLRQLFRGLDTVLLELVRSKETKAEVQGLPPDGSRALPRGVEILENHHLAAQH